MADRQRNVFVQLTGVGFTAPFPVPQFRHHTFQYVIANINTNVVVRAEGTLDGTSWFNLDVNETNTTKTANGTYLMHKSDFTCFQIRFRIISEAGGSAVTVDVTYMGKKV